MFPNPLFRFGFVVSELPSAISSVSLKKGGPLNKKHNKPVETKGLRAKLKLSEPRKQK